MKIESVEFVRSAAGADDLPREGLPEVCMVGRSNVGKSTLINALVRRTIARTSATPGKTRLLNLYRIVTRPTGPFYVVDLPGYGYVRKKDAREEFDRLAALYFARATSARAARDQSERPNVRTSERHGGRLSDSRTLGLSDSRDVHVAVLMAVDARHAGIDSDLVTAAWLRSAGFAPLVVVTKLDKLSRPERGKALRAFEGLFGGAHSGAEESAGAFGNAVIGVSAVTGEGMEELWKRMVPWIASAAEASRRLRSRP